MSEGAVLDAGDVVGRDVVDDVADVVIVGSGAAGATAARVLVDAGLDVIVLEEGPDPRRHALRSDMYTSMKRTWRGLGMQAAEGRAFTPVLQGRCVGGTTFVNGAIIHRMPEVVHRAWEAEHGLAGVLPYAELERIWDTLDRELSVAPAPEEVLGENNRLLREGLHRLGVTGNEIRRNVRGCRGSAHCNQGCPTGAKQSMTVTYVPRAVAGGARVYAECEATRVMVSGARATGVVGRFASRGGARGPAMRARARRAVLLAASAIQTPLLLAASGVGRRSGLVGARLQAHPGAGVVAVFDRPVRPWFGATQGYESTHYYAERMKFEAVGMPLEFAAARFPGVGPAGMRELGEHAHTAIWGVQVRARAHGSVGRGLFGTRVRYDMTDDDLQVLRLGIRRLCEVGFAAGAREVWPGVHGVPEAIRSLDELAPLERIPPDPRRFHCIMAHLFGTAVMGRHASTSVVAPSFETHELAGLHVVDSSVFPTNLGVNPQHTICSIAWLAAERLAGRRAHAS
ncbi:MAG: GMC family oxidoreductase [Polyangiaceae bacterium]|nr:GMC family oxidoreductase [Polyangiaceae bacterium]